MSIKSFIKNSPILYNIIKKTLFFKDVFPKDIFNLSKILLFIRVYPYTMISYKRLSNVYELSKKVEKEKIKGAFAECGVWKGGCAAIAAFVAKKAKSNRKIWLFDSFQGLPEPTEKDGEMAKGYALEKASGKLSSINQCVGTLDDVKDIFFSKLKINKNNVEIKKGWFQNTLFEARKRVGPIAILRLDGDWYESTKVCLDNLYDNVITGGYVIIDDYGHWEGSRVALDEFFKERKLNPVLIKIDYTGAYFKKP